MMIIDRILFSPCPLSGYTHTHTHTHTSNGVQSVGDTKWLLLSNIHHQLQQICYVFLLVHSAHSSALVKNQAREVWII